MEFNKRKEMLEHLAAEQDIVKRDIKQFESETIKKGEMKSLIRIEEQNQMKHDVAFKQRVHQERIQQEHLIDEQNKRGPGWMQEMQSN